MQIKNENIILRDMTESDINDYVRWFTTVTEWANWDAPWETTETVEYDDTAQRRDWTEYYESVKEMSDDVLRWKFEIEYDGNHIGWVSSYLIDENYRWIPADDVKSGQITYRAVGIDICEEEVWGSGVGTNALRTFIRYYFNNGCDEIYTQTWSGNKRMLRCAEKLGFEICNRYSGEREVNGERYDALTLKVSNKV